jgi:hypothetical protein
MLVSDARLLSLKLSSNSCSRQKAKKRKQTHRNTATKFTKFNSSICNGFPYPGIVCTVHYLMSDEKTISIKTQIMLTGNEWYE